MVYVSAVFEVPFKVILTLCTILVAIKTWAIFIGLLNTMVNLLLPVNSVSDSTSAIFERAKIFVGSPLMLSKVYSW